MVGQAGSTKYVLRKKPPGQVLSSAHAVEREFQVLLQCMLCKVVSKLVRLVGAAQTLEGSACECTCPAGHGVLGEHRCPSPQSALPLHRLGHPWHAILCHAACSGKTKTCEEASPSVLAWPSRPCSCARVCCRREVSSPPGGYFKIIACCLWTGPHLH